MPYPLKRQEDCMREGKHCVSDLCSIGKKEASGEALFVDVL
jgi:hypothetical protein